MAKDSRVLCFEHYRNSSRSYGEEYGHLRLLVFYATPSRYALNARYYTTPDDKMVFTDKLTALLKEQRGSDEYFPDRTDYVEFKFQSGGSPDMDLDNWYGGDVSFGLHDSQFEAFDRVRKVCKAADLRLHSHVDDLPQKLIRVLLAAKAVPLRVVDVGHQRTERVRDLNYRVEDHLPTTAQRKERERLLAEAEERRLQYEAQQAEADQELVAAE